MPVSSRSVPLTRSATIGPRRTSAASAPAKSVDVEAAFGDAERRDAGASAAPRAGSSPAAVRRCPPARRVTRSRGPRYRSTTREPGQVVARSAPCGQPPRWTSSRAVPTSRTVAIDASSTTTPSAGSAIVRLTRSVTSAAADRAGHEHQRRHQQRRHAAPPAERPSPAGDSRGSASPALDRQLADYNEALDPRQDSSGRTLRAHARHPSAARVAGVPGGRRRPPTPRPGRRRARRLRRRGHRHLSARTTPGSSTTPPTTTARCATCAWCSTRRSGRPATSRCSARCAPTASRTRRSRRSTCGCGRGRRATIDLQVGRVPPTFGLLGSDRLRRRQPAGQPPAGLRLSHLAADVMPCRAPWPT